MNHKDTQLAKAVFDSMFLAARGLNFFELAQLRACYMGQTTYEQLSDKLQRHFCDIGLAAINAGGSVHVAKS